MHKFFWAQAEELQQFVSPSSQQGFAHYLSFSIRTFDFFSCLSLEFCEFHPTDVAPLSSPVWIQELRYLCHHTNQLLMGTDRRSSSGPTWAGGIQPFLLLRDRNYSTLCSCFAPLQPWEQRILQPGYLTSASPPRPSGYSWNYIDLMWFAPEKSVLASSLWFYYLRGVSIDYFTLCPRIFPRNGVGQAEGSLLGFLFFLFQSQGTFYSSCHHLLRAPQKSPLGWIPPALLISGPPDVSMGVFQPGLSSFPAPGEGKWWRKTDFLQNRAHTKTQSWEILVSTSQERCLSHRSAGK